MSIRLLNKKKLIGGLVSFVITMSCSAFAVSFYEHSAVKYIWLFTTFVCGAALLPKLFLELIYTKSAREILYIPSLVLISFALAFDIGERALILGIGIGITYTVILLLCTYYPFIFGSANKAKKK